jgi:hypothetical protein
VSSDHWEESVTDASDPYDLSRFVQAQKRDYDEALR